MKTAAGVVAVYVATYLPMIAWMAVCAWVIQPAATLDWALWSWFMGAVLYLTFLFLIVVDAKKPRP